MAGNKKPTDLGAEAYEELVRLLRMYLREAKRARDAKAYLASCVMEAAGIEALLMIMIDGYLDEAVATGKYPHRKKVPKPILDLTLAELISIAKAAGWLPAGLDYAKDDWDPKKAEIGDYAEVAREIRNFTHPGRYARDHHKKRITATMVRLLVDISHGVSSSLMARIEDDKEG
jgi:hypothetical protein